jgi:hypothetical protein
VVQLLVALAAEAGGSDAVVAEARAALPTVIAEACPLLAEAVVAWATRRTVQQARRATAATPGSVQALAADWAGPIAGIAVPPTGSDGAAGTAPADTAGESDGDSDSDSDAGLEDGDLDAMLGASTKAALCGEMALQALCAVCAGGGEAAVTWLRSACGSGSGAEETPLMRALVTLGTAGTDAAVSWAALRARELVSRLL